MKTVYRKVNSYFFGAEEISTSDALWFYGAFAIGEAAMILCAAVNAINL